MCRTLALMGFLLVFSHIQSQSSLAITNGHIIDTESGAVATEMSILIQEGIITEVGKTGKINIPPETTVIDAHGKWIMPGMIDGHVHFFQSGGLYTRPDVIDLRKQVPYESERKWLDEQATDLFERYLAAGITYVCDVGGPMTNYALRDRAEAASTAPDLFVTGPLISTYQPDAFQIPDPPIIKISSPEEARTLVQKQLPYKPDFIKIWYIVRRGESAEKNLDIIKATIEESHQHGIQVAVHATQYQTAKLAVEAGADILVHSVDDRKIDDKFISLLKANEVSYIPTMIVSKKYEEVLSQHLSLSNMDFQLANPFTLGTLTDLQHLPKEALPGWVPQLMSRPLEQDPRLAIKAYNLKQLMDAGINIVTGTDAGNIGTLHASSFFEEIEAMKAAGLTEAEILKASTINGANMLNLQDERGSIAPGKSADIILLNQNPLQDLKHLQSIHRIIHKGNLIEPDTLITPTPEAIAQRQLNAYNARNIEAFLACYHPDVRIYNYPDQLLYTGLEKMRETYSGFFENTPNLHCELVNRITIGNKVIDREKVTGLQNGRVIEAVAIYTIENGKITEVYFIRG